MSYIVSTSILGIQTFVTRFDPSAREAALITHTEQLEEQLWWQWQPGRDDECEPRRSYASVAAAEERWPPEVASETMAAKGWGNGRSNASGYRRGYGPRDRGYG
jgi:hypothetical protein